MTSRWSEFPWWDVFARRHDDGTRCYHRGRGCGRCRPGLFRRLLQRTGGAT